MDFSISKNDIFLRFVLMVCENVFLFCFYCCFEIYFLPSHLEPPRFLNVSNSIIIAPLDSTVNFLCQIYGIPKPTVTWYKVIAKDKQIVDHEDLKLFSVNSQKYEYNSFRFLFIHRFFFSCLV